MTFPFPCVCVYSPPEHYRCASGSEMNPSVQHPPKAPKINCDFLQQHSLHSEPNEPKPWPKDGNVQPTHQSQRPAMLSELLSLLSFSLQVGFCATVPLWGVCGLSSLCHHGLPWHASSTPSALTWASAWLSLLCPTSLQNTEWPLPAPCLLLAYIVSHVITS